MKTRFWIYILLLSAVALALALYWRRPAQELKMHGGTVMASTNASAPRAPKQSAPGKTNQIASSPRNPYFSTNRKSLPEMVERAIENDNKPIDFYGLIIDQNSNPVPDITVKAGIRHWTKMDPAFVEFGLGSTQIEIEKVTGSDGRFEISGVSGDTFGVLPVPKDGYLLSPKAPRGFGSGTSGSYENPVIFKMWKKGPEEHLVGGNHVFGIDSGKAYTLDLLAGKKNAGKSDGDVLVSITRPAGVKARDRYPWSFSIQAIQGGFAEPEPDDEFMYIAPASGYQPTIEMQFDPNSPSWTPVASERLFFSSRNGQVYGSATIEIDSVYNVHSAIQINYTLNPNGSRNLEP